MTDNQQLIKEMASISVQVTLNGKEVSLKGRELFALIASAQLISQDPENGEVARTALLGARKLHGLLEPFLLAEQLDKGWKLNKCDELSISGEGGTYTWVLELGDC